MSQKAKAGERIEWKVAPYARVRTLKLRRAR
jgi:hypothetical protein